MLKENNSWHHAMLAIAAGIVVLVAADASATDGAWTNIVSGLWGVAGNWASGAIADGDGATAWFTNDITGNRTITVNTNSRALGHLNVGDANGDYAFTFAANGGAKLIFTNGGASAHLNQVSTSRGDTLNSTLALALGDSLEIANASASNLTIQGAVTGAVAGTRTLSNVGNGAGAVAISGVIGNGGGMVAIVQNSPNSQLNLSGANTFTGGVFIKSGTVKGSSSTTALGFGLVTIGDTSGSADATLVGGLASTAYANPIAVASNNTGTAMIGNAGNGQQWSGLVTLYDHDLTIYTPGDLNLRLLGGIAGIGNLTLSSSGSGSPYGIISLQNTPVNHTGTIVNVGAGTAEVTISGGVGSNVTAITENSSSSPLTIDTTILTVNSAGTILANNNPGGSALFTIAYGVKGIGDLILRNNSSIPNGITLSARSITNAGRVVNSGTGPGNTLISATIGANVSQVVQDSATSPLVLKGANSYSSGTTISNGVLMASNTSGSATGTGLVDIMGGGILQGDGAVSGPINVNGGLLRGNGTMSGTVTNLSGGTVSPGLDGTAGGTLTIGNLVWNGGSTVKCEIASISNNEAGAGTDYDRILVNGSLTAVPAGNLVLRMDSLGQTLPLLSEKNYSLQVISCGTAATLTPTDVTLDTNSFLVGGTWMVTNVNRSIYVVCMGNTSTNKNYWIGSGSWSNATNWSKGHAPLPGEDVEFDFRGPSSCTANLVSNNLGSITLTAGYTGTVNFVTNAVQGGMSLTVSGDIAVYGGNITFNGDTTALNGGTAGNPFGIGYAIQASNILIGVNGSINADSKGFVQATGPGRPPSGVGAGSYGGQGGQTNAAYTNGPCYGSASAPSALGTGGGPGSTAIGGGAIKVTVTERLTVNGRLSANGKTANSNTSGGSGGSIWLAGGTLDGTGLIAANGGNGPGTGADGGGGRIDLSGMTNNFAGAIQANGGNLLNYATPSRGLCGSILLPQSDGTGLTLASFRPYTNIAFGNSLTFGDALITNGVTLSLDANTNQNTFAFSSLTIATNSAVVCCGNLSAVNTAAGGSAGRPYGQGVTIIATNVTIQTGGSLNANGQGFRRGPGAGTYFVGDGVYGGLNRIPAVDSGSTYGSISNVTALGCGGETGIAYAEGGGAIRLMVSDTLTVDGTVSCLSLADAGVRGGSGGSIWIDCATLQGAGAISANGGNHGTGGAAGASGSGGRIHIVYNAKGITNPVDNAQVTAYGGGTVLATKSAAGTILLTDRGAGDWCGALIIDNNLAASNLVTTLLPTNSDCFAGMPPSLTVDRTYVRGNGVLELPQGKALCIVSAFSNGATFFAASNSTVAYVGTNEAAVYGNITNANLSISNTAPKTVRFQAGSTNTVFGALVLYNASVLSLADGEWWYLYLDQATGTQDVRNVSARDSNATNGLTIVDVGGANLEHNVNWLFTGTPPGTIFVYY